MQDVGEIFIENSPHTLKTKWYHMTDRRVVSHRHKFFFVVVLKTPSNINVLQSHKIQPPKIPNQLQQD
jgi:hypothetical protein